MATEVESALGDCPDHGEVEGIREIPRVTFPPVFTAIRRAIAKRRRPYLCPTCGKPVATD